MTTPNEQITTPAEPSLRYLSVCSGMEAASVAWHPLGFQAVGFSEIEPFPCAILKQRFPNTTNYGSLTEHNSWPIEQGAVDLLVGGTPCQSFSVAGLRKGMSDPRGNLALTFLALADRLRPRWIVWENVPGVLSSNGGNDFASFLGALGQLGYGWAYRVLDAQYVGGPRAVPQRRRRVFVVACLGNSTAPAEVLSIAESLRGYIEKGNKKRKGVATDARKGVEADGLHRTVGTLCADTHPGAYSGQDAYTGRLIPESIPFRKSKRAQSTTDDESWVKAEASNTLNNFDLGDTRTTHAVVQPVAFTQNQREEVRLLGDKVGAISLPGTHQQNYIAQPIISPTITTCKGSRGGCSDEALEEIKAVHLAQQPMTATGKVSHPLTAAYRSSEDGCGRGTPIINTTVISVGTDCYNGAITGQVAATMGTSGSSVNAAGPTVMTTTLKATPGDQMPHVAYCAEKAGTLTVGHGSSAGHQHRMGDNSFLIAPIVPMAVRRLTPVECERLQGFPDNWSRISWKGKPEEDCPDGPRYKACGNSMAVPVMRWIGERIKEVDAKLSK